MDPSIDDIIAKDRAEHPNCSYSESSQHVCSSSMNNNTTCEIITEIRRMCPRERPVKIYSKTERNTGDEGSLDEEGFGGIFGSARGFESFPVDPWSALNRIFGGIEELPPHSTRRPPVEGFGARWGSGFPKPTDKEPDTFISGTKKGKNESV